ncbi:MAG: carbohydrate-binding module family 20 domain-containing protein [Prevotella sp.]|jgi:hypothetical protein
MKLTFHLPYKAQWGETLEVNLHLLTAVGRDKTEYIPMHTDDGLNWSTDYNVLHSWHHAYCAIFYTYQLRDGIGEVKRRECNPVPRVVTLIQDRDYEFYDYWMDLPLHWQSMNRDNELAVYLRPDKVTISPLPLSRITVVLNVRAYGLLPNEQIGVLGDTPTMGRWQVNHYLPMTKVGDNAWTMAINADMIEHFPFLYKYVIVDAISQRMIYWESGDNRVSCPMVDTPLNKVIVHNDNLVRISRMRAFEAKQPSSTNDDERKEPDKVRQLF